MAAGTKKWSAETKSGFIITFFLGWPSRKVLEHKISGIKRLSTKIENLIRPNQFGFQKGKRTSHALLYIINYITRTFNDNRFVFIDS